VIMGSAVNHDGRSNGLLAPNPDAQAEVLVEAGYDGFMRSGQQVVCPSDKR